MSYSVDILKPEMEYLRTGFEDGYEWLSSTKKQLSSSEASEKFYCLYENTRSGLENNFEKGKSILEPHKISNRAGVLGFISGGSVSGIAGYKAGEKLGLFMLNYGGDTTEELLPFAVASGSIAFIGVSMYGGYRTSKALTKMEERILDKNDVDHINLKDVYEEIKEEFD